MTAAPHQATGVALGQPRASRALLIEGPPGSGKSSLALALIDRGATLVGDDGVLLERRESRLWALPPPTIAGRLEVRNVGILAVAAEAAPVSLVIRLDEEAPRFVETAEAIVLAGVRVPLIRLWPDSPVLALRAERALALHGTP
jgi:serine kinase of HPr protein (carbohydrate metabolism regulator)